MKRDGKCDFGLLQRLVGIVSKGDDRLDEVSSWKSTIRVYAELLRLAAPDPAAPDLWAIKPLPPLRELASQASTTRELVASALNRLYPSGVIRRRGNNLYIMNRAAVEGIVHAARQAEAL